MTELAAEAEESELDSREHRDEPGRERRRSAAIGAAIAMAPLVLFLLLRPETYGLAPNSLDPVFYTGYSMNLDDVLIAAGDRHYFVTRWTAYLPVYLVDRLVGPIAGRLVWRWVIAACLAAGLWGLGQRLRWGNARTWLGIVVVLSTPMFLRAFLTDYVEYLVVAFGLGLVVTTLREEQNWLSGAVFGLLAGSMLVANPGSIFIVAVCSVSALVVMRGTWPGRLVFVAVVSASTLAVFLLGFVWFDWRYNIPNVYQPTIDFIRTYPGDPDAWRSPRRDWMGRYLWIYVPLMVFGAALALRLIRHVRFTRLESAAILMSGVFYVYQWFEQFARGGFSLEVSYFWSYGLPTLLIALVVVVNRLAEDVPEWWVWAMIPGWIALLVGGLPGTFRLPPGLMFALVAGVVAGIIVASLRRQPIVAASALLMIVVWVQIGAPSYDPSAYFGNNTSPRYDQIIGNLGSESDEILGEIIWFSEEMDTIPEDAQTSFVSVGGWSSSITGIYAPHVTGRILYPTPMKMLDDQSVLEIKSGARPIVAVFGDPDDVEIVADNMVAQVGAGELLLDSEGGDLGYRLMVFAMPDATNLPFTWSASSLPRVTGQPRGGSVEVGPPSPPGVVTYGPYATLEPGRYEATLRYRTADDAAGTVGSFDVATLAGGTVAVTDLEPNEDGVVAIEFEVTEEAGAWEFRTSWTGVTPIVFESITLSSL